MAKLWNTNTKKWSVVVAMALAGYHALTMQFGTLPSIPYVNNMVLAVAGAATIYGAWMLIDEQI
jgi:hypothetical protein